MAPTLVQQLSRPPQHAVSAVTGAPSSTQVLQLEQAGPVDRVSKLPAYWKQPPKNSLDDRLHKRDQKWVAEALFDRQGTWQLDELKDPWLYPPPPAVAHESTSTSKPKVDEYFTQRMFVWAPRKMYKIPLDCPHCESPLTSKGTYNRIREVLDIDCRYYIITECLRCWPCQKKQTAQSKAGEEVDDSIYTFTGYHPDIMSQVDEGHRSLFPAVLTAKKALDIKVVTMLRARTLGNSSRRMRCALMELHNEAWARCCLQYLSACQLHKNKADKGMDKHLVAQTPYDRPPPLPPMECARWLVTCHSVDMMARIDGARAKITSTFGRVLKMDSSKKVSVDISILLYYQISLLLILLN